MEPLLILPTKLYIPPSRPETVIRHHLLNLINDNFRLKTILVAAPAGFGKTTLLCNWIQQLNHPVAWFSVSEGDNDPVIFFSYLISALQTIDPMLGESVFPMLQSPQMDFNLVLTNLIQVIDQRNDEMVLVLDDYHYIKEKQIHNLVDFLINHKPGHLHLVISSRSDPLLPLHRYRAKNHLTEIRAGHLSFSDEEAYAFFNKVMGLNLTSENVTNLNHRTEGWITGLQMAALSLKSHDNIDGFVKSFTGNNRYVMDYLLEEVISVQTDKVKSFLLQTSILERSSSHLCEAVTGIENCQEIIDTLDRENLFLVALDSDKTWYRYHQLFSDLLRKKLRDTHPELLPDLHKNASKWFAEHDFIPEALEHSIAAKDWNNAGLLVERTFMDRMNRGEDFATMLDRLKALPEEMICTRPSLCIMYAWMYSLNLQLDEAESYLQIVENEEGENLNTDLRMQIEVIRAEMARNRGDLRYCIKSSLDTLDKITNNSSGSHVQMQNHTACIMSLAWAYLLTGEMERAVQKFQESLNIANEVGSITLILIHQKGLAQTYMLQGRLKSSGQVLEEGLKKIIESTGPHGQLPTAAAFIYLEYGNYLRELNRLSDAQRYIKQGLDLAIARRIDGASLQDGFIYLARTKYAQHDLAACFKTFEEAEQHLAIYFHIKGFRDPLDTWKAALTLSSVTSNRDSIIVEKKRILEDWISSQDITARPEVNSITDELRFLLWAHWYIHKRQYQEALRLLDHLIMQADKNGRYERIITILILQAIACEASGDIQKALRLLCRALDLAEPEGYLRIFLDEEKIVSGLLKKLASQEVFDEEGIRLPVPLNFVNKLILSLEAGIHQTIPADLTDPLSKREQDVLLLLSAELSNHDIAEKLFISIDTVKSHLKNINVKLNTVNRKQAVERALELGLL
jgi:LuxR family maltose regulon positive regulatory protein